MIDYCSDVDFARLNAPVLIQEVAQDWDRPRPIGFGDAVDVDPPPLYWWVRSLKAHRFVGYCLWYDTDSDHKYDFTGFGYWMPRVGGGMPAYTWCRRHFHVDVALGRREPIYSDAGKHSMRTRPIEGSPEAFERFRAWDISETTNLASQPFLEASEGLQDQMGDTAQLPMNWVDIDIRNWVSRFSHRARKIGVQETRGLLFYRPDVVLDILLRLGKVASLK